MYCKLTLCAFIRTYREFTKHPIYYYLFYFNIRNNDHWPLRRITLFPRLLAPLGLNLAPHFVEGPLWIPACLKGLFYMEIFLFPIFNLCNEALTSFQQRSHHTQFMFNGVVRAEVQILISVGRFPVDL